MFELYKLNFLLIYYIIILLIILMIVHKMNVQITNYLNLFEYNFLGPRLMYPKRSMYYAIMALDLVLRFAWVLTLIPPDTGASFALPHYLTAVSMILELYRRTVWGFLRLENEHRSNTAG